MEKNENGYPIRRNATGFGFGDCCPTFSGNTDRSRDNGNNGVGDVGMGNGNGMTDGNGEMRGARNHSCGGGGCLDNMPLAYVYAPDQRFRMLYSAHEALHHGTLFEELYKPMEVYGNE